jgi:hypothetical protein
MEGAVSSSRGGGNRPTFYANRQGAELLVRPTPPVETDG